MALQRDFPSVPPQFELFENLGCASKKGVNAKELLLDVFSNAIKSFHSEEGS